MTNAKANRLTALRDPNSICPNHDRLTDAEQHREVCAALTARLMELSKDLNSVSKRYVNLQEWSLSELNEVSDICEPDYTRAKIKHTIDRLINVDGDGNLVLNC